MRSVFLISVLILASLAAAVAQRPTTTNTVTAPKPPNLSPTNPVVYTKPGSPLIYENKVLDAPRWGGQPLDLPTFRNFEESNTNSLRVLITGNTTKKPGFYLLSKGSRVLHAIEAAQMRVPFDLSESGLQRAQTNGTWAFVYFQKARQHSDEVPNWNEIPAWKLILLEDGDHIQITLPPVF